MQRLPLFLRLALACLTVSACSRQHDDRHTHAASSASHAHHAPHGGTLVALGHHQFNLEFVHDDAAGKLTAYVLDAHAENFIRSPLAAIDLVVDLNGAPTTLSLAAVVNPATGETVGNTSEFAAQADWLKTAGPLNITIPVLMFRGATFTAVTCRVPEM